MSARLLNEVRRRRVAGWQVSQLEAIYGTLVVECAFNSSPLDHLFRWTWRRALRRYKARVHSRRVAARRQP